LRRHPATDFLPPSDFSNRSREKEKPEVFSVAVSARIDPALLHFAADVQQAQAKPKGSGFSV